MKIKFGFEKDTKKIFSVVGDKMVIESESGFKMEEFDLDTSLYHCDTMWVDSVPESEFKKHSEYWSKRESNKTEDEEKRFKLNSSVVIYDDKGNLQVINIYWDRYCNAPIGLDASYVENMECFNHPYYTEPDSTEIIYFDDFEGHF